MFFEFQNYGAACSFFLCLLRRPKQRWILSRLSIRWHQSAFVVFSAVLSLHLVRLICRSYFAQHSCGGILWILLFSDAPVQTHGS